MHLAPEKLRSEGNHAGRRREGHLLIMASLKNNPDYAAILAKPFVTKSEIAQVFGVSLKSIHNWQKARLIPFMRIGKGTIRFDVAEVKAAILKRRVGCLYDADAASKGRQGAN